MRTTFDAEEASGIDAASRMPSAAADVGTTMQQSNPQATPAARREKKPFIANFVAFRRQPNL